MDRNRRSACAGIGDRHGPVPAILALAEDFPRLWNAPSTKAKDKKRLLRLLIKDITIQRTGPKVVTLGIRWQGDACEEIQVDRPPSVVEQVRYRDDMVERVRDLAQNLTDDQIARHLNDDGHRPSKGTSFTVSMVRWIRFKHEIPAPELKRPDELTVKQVADKFGVKPGVVYYWIERGLIPVRRRNRGSPCWLTLSPEKEQELREWVRSSTRIRKSSKQSEGVL